MSSKYTFQYASFYFNLSQKESYSKQPSIVMIMGISMDSDGKENNHYQYGRSFFALLDAILQLKVQHDFNITNVIFIPTGFLHRYNALAEKSLLEENPHILTQDLASGLLDGHFDPEAIERSVKLDRDWTSEHIPYAKAKLAKENIEVCDPAPSWEEWRRSEEAKQDLQKVLRLYQNEENHAFKKVIDKLAHEKVDRFEKKTHILTESQKQTLLYDSTLYLLEESTSAFWFISLVPTLPSQGVMTYPSRAFQPAFQYALNHFTVLQDKKLTYVGYAIKEVFSKLQAEYLEALDSAINAIQSDDRNTLSSIAQFKEYLQSLVAQVYAQNKNSNEKLDDCNKLIIFGIRYLMQVAEEKELPDSLCIDLGSAITDTITQGIKKDSEKNFDAHITVAPLDFPKVEQLIESVQPISYIENDYLNVLGIAHASDSLSSLPLKKMIIEEYLVDESSGIIKGIWATQAQSNAEKISDCYRLLLLSLKFLIGSSHTESINPETNEALSINIVETVMKSIQSSPQSILDVLPLESNKPNHLFFQPPKPPADDEQAFYIDETPSPF